MAQVIISIGEDVEFFTKSVAPEDFKNEGTLQMWSICCLGVVLFNITMSAT